MENVGQKIRICLLTNNINQLGGVERVISILSRYFVNEAGYDVTILSLYSKQTNTVFELDENVKIVNGALDLSEDITPYLSNILSENNYDVLFTFHSGIGLSFAKIRKSFPKLRWIATEHSSPYDYTWKRKLLNLITYHFADKFVVLTDSAKKYYKSRLILHTYAIPNAVSFEIEEQSDYTSKKILAVGRLEQVKRFDLLIKAFGIASKDFPEWTLDVVGDGSQADLLKSTARECGVDDKVNFCGADYNIKDRMLRSSCLAITSEHEGFPMVALEAMECGLPIVSFDLSAITNMTKGYDSKIIVPQGDLDGLAKVLSNLMLDNKKLIEMGSESKHCAAQYHISNVGKQWESLIESLL